MSAHVRFTPKDIDRRLGNVRFVPEAELRTGHSTYAIVGFAGARWISRMSPWCTVAT
jgi:hypothetical protein